MIGEKGDFVPKGDEGRIKIVEAYHRNSDSVPDFKHAFVVGNETFLTCSFDADDVWQPMDEILSNFTKGPAHQVSGRFANIKLQHVSIVVKIHHFFKVGGAKAGVQASDGAAQGIDDVVDVGPSGQVTFFVLVDVV